MHWKDTKDNEIYLKKRFFYTNLSFILNTYIEISHVHSHLTIIKL